MIDPISLLAMFGPVVVEAGKALTNRFLAPSEIKPMNVDEAVKLKQVELDYFKAVSEAGGQNASYPWVEAAVRLMRPGVAVIVLGTWATLNILMPDVDSSSVDNFAAAVGFYLFGDRTLFYAKKK